MRRVTFIITEEFMSLQSTDNLNWFLCHVRTPEDLNEYLAVIRKESAALSLNNYLNRIIHEKGLLLRNVVSESNLEQHYAYQIINGNKTNPSRIKVIALCIACHMTLAEAQHALGISQNGILYPRNPFDAIIIYNLNIGNWSVYNINEQLHAEGLMLIE